MKVIVDISSDDMKRIRSLLAAETFSSLSHFVNLAIQNQINLEGDISQIPTLESLVQSQTKSAEGITEDESPPRPKKSRRIRTVSAPQIDDSFPFWGTQNKYLCLKQIVLEFSRMASEEGKPWMRYDIVMNRLLKDAVETRERLEAVDKHHRRPRGQKLSAGFPRNDSKSITRYEKQFIGGLDGKGNYYGMAVMMGYLAVRRSEDSDRLEFGITKDGLRFSNLQSPVFRAESPDFSPSTPPLSDDEIQCIVLTLKEERRSEIELMNFTLDYIKSGKSRPREGCQPTKEYLDRTFRDMAKEKKEGSFSSSEADTIRAGVVSRLNELNFIRIERRGTESMYHITEAGHKFM
ncbi:MAG: hypothetical protein KAR39_03985 [Thermoplasmata archaeon]|nr:hypothetical protein [Thermoplasmata archaeon]